MMMVMMVMVPMQMRGEDGRYSDTCGDWDGGDGDSVSDGGVDGEIYSVVFAA